MTYQIYHFWTKKPCYCSTVIPISLCIFFLIHGTHCQNQRPYTYIWSLSKSTILNARLSLFPRVHCFQNHDVTWRHTHICQNQHASYRPVYTTFALARVTYRHVILMGSGVFWKTTKPSGVGSRRWTQCHRSWSNWLYELRKLFVTFYRTRNSYLFSFQFVGVPDMTALVINIKWDDRSKFWNSILMRFSELNWMKFCCLLHSLVNNICVPGMDMILHCNESTKSLKLGIVV